MTRLITLIEEVLYTKKIIKYSLNELDYNRVYKIEGIVITDLKDRNQQDILSDIRSLPGITTVNNKDLPFNPTPEKSILKIKIDPYPYIKQDKFKGTDTIDHVLANIKKVRGVKSFKLTKGIE